MKFTDLNVEAFGVWSGLELRSLSPQLIVLCGANEAGKTTIVESLRGVLYGFSPRRRDRYLPPVHGGVGAVGVGLCVDDQHYSARRLDDGSRLLGGLTVTGPDGTTQGESQLADLLGGIDERTYTGVFAVSLRELQELATLNDTQAADWLYDLSTGLDGVSIGDVLRELRTSRVGLLSAEGDRSQIIDLVAKRDAMRAEIEELSGLSERYWELSSQRAAADESVRAAEVELGKLAAEAQTIKLTIDLREPCRERIRIDERLAGMGEIGKVPADSLQRLARIVAALRRARRRRVQIKQRREALRQQRRQIQVNESLWRQAARIGALAEHETWIATLDEQLRTCEKKVAERAGQLTQARAKYGLLDAAASTSGTRPTPNAAALRGPAMQLRQARKRLIDARDECGAHAKNKVARRDELDRALAGRPHKNLAAALESQGQLVAQLRRRLTLDDRLDQMAMHREELEEKQSVLLDRQVMPLWLLIAIAAVFVLGAGLFLAGLIIPWGFGAMTVGGVIAVGAAAGKLWYERASRGRLDAAQRQLQMLDGQLKQAKQERSELDERLPKGGGALASRLQAAEGELASLEELLEIDASRQAAATEADAAKQRLQNAADEWKRTRGRWQHALAEAGLPENLSPPQVKQILAHGGEFQKLERELEQAREERDRWRREYSSVLARIEQLEADAGWAAPSSAAPLVALVDRLRRLRREVAAQEELVEQRGQTERKLDRLRRWAVHYHRRTRLLARRRRELFAAAGAVDGAEFRRRAGQRAEQDELLRRRSTLAEQIATALQGRASESEMARLIALPPGELEQRLDELAARQQNTSDEIRRLCEERGRISQEQTMLADDRRVAEKQLDLGVVEQRIREAAARWRVLATTEHLIESVKEEYERNRQPDVLQDASRHLERLTEGRYRRVWTPLGERSLRVDDDQNRSLPIELLSTGAREQLFLSLRLALVSRYTRQGKLMPLVLDDVLVNFDGPRAAAAARVFADYAAAGNQIILFTCHEHIANLFRALQADVRTLPANGDATRKIVRPERQESETRTDPPRRRRERRAKEPRADHQVTAEAGTVSISTDELDARLNSPVHQELVVQPPLISTDADQPAEAAQPQDEIDAATVSKADRRHRADPPHRPTRVRSKRRRWSAEEFDGELADQVNVALTTEFAPAFRRGFADEHDRVHQPPSSNGNG